MNNYPGVEGLFGQDWLVVYPVESIHSTRVFVTFQCRLAGRTLPGQKTIYGQLVMEPVAIAVVVDGTGGKIALAPGISVDRIESLLSERAGWPKVV